MIDFLPFKAFSFSAPFGFFHYDNNFVEEKMEENNFGLQLTQKFWPELLILFYKYKKKLRLF